MVLTQFKSKEEIDFILKDKQKIGIFSCGTCSNLCDTGGSAGIKTAKKVLKDLNKEVVFSQIVTALCPISITKKASKKKKKEINKCDAIIALSCASGVKALILENPKTPIITFLDSTGSAVVTEKEDPISSSICLNCGECVISFTNGICPYSKCPAKSKYGPCKKFIPENETCQIDNSLKCIWYEIIKRVDISPLKELEQIHKKTTNNYPQKNKRTISNSLVKITGFIAYNTKFFDLFVRRLVNKINK